MKSFTNFNLCHAGFVEVSHKQNLLVGKSISGKLFTLSGAAFLFAILHVFLSSARSQVRRIYTGAIVALVHYIVAFWNRANEMLMRKSVNTHNLFVAHKCSVAAGSFSSNPNPAVSKFGFVGRNWPKLVGFVQQSINWFFVHNNETARHSKRESRKTTAAFGITGENINLSFLSRFKAGEASHNLA